jgi:hypothetical protein
MKGETWNQRLATLPQGPASRPATSSKCATYHNGHVKNWRTPELLVGHWRSKWQGRKQYHFPIFEVSTLREGLRKTNP